MKLDKTHRDHLESRIRPPMLAAITIPVMTDAGRDTGIAIYVAHSQLTTVPLNSQAMFQLANELTLVKPSLSLLVPEYEEARQTLSPAHDLSWANGYPGEIKPGHYDHQQLVDMLREHRNNPEAILFIADMLE